METTPFCAKAIWLDRFATHLGALLPAIDAPVAWSLAEALYADSAAIDPREAAVAFTLELPPHQIGTPGD